MIRVIIKWLRQISIVYGPEPRTTERRTTATATVLQLPGSTFASSLTPDTYKYTIIPNENVLEYIECAGNCVKPLLSPSLQGVVPASSAMPFCAVLYPTSDHRVVLSALPAAALDRAYITFHVLFVRRRRDAKRRAPGYSSGGLVS